MFELGHLIPAAYAQAANAAKKAAAGGAKAAATETGDTGISGMVRFIVTHIDNWIAGIVIVVVSYALARMAAAAVKEAIIRRREDVQESALLLVERISKIIIVGIGVTIALAINGLNFTAVIGAISLGIGFALKDSISTFISSIILLAQDRFRIGDFIQISDILGTIVSIDTRVTILQALDGSEVVIPNQTMLNQTVISYSTNPFRRVDLPVGVDYKTSLPMVTSLIQGVMEKHPDVVAKPAPTVLIDEFGESSINLIARFWVESRANWLDIKSNMAHRVKQAFDKVGVNIPFPIRTLKLDENDRAFLQTMDSMKKGYVPAPATVPDDSAIKEAASGTQNAVHVPRKIFAEEKHADLVQAMDNAVAAPAAPPASIGAPAPATVGAPPTHL